MKHTYVILCAFFCLFMTTHLVQAQGKAYDKVYYTTKLNSQVIQLIYADGYLAGSTVRIFQGKNDRLLLPQSGAPDDNGDLKFVPEKGGHAMADYVLLKDVDEQSEVPLTFHAVAVINGIRKPVLFKRLNHSK